jgi:hypothetical protein
MARLTDEDGIDGPWERAIAAPVRKPRVPRMSLRTMALEELARIDERLATAEKRAAAAADESAVGAFERYAFIAGRLGADIAIARAGVAALADMFRPRRAKRSA